MSPLPIRPHALLGLPGRWRVGGGGYVYVHVCFVHYWCLYKVTVFAYVSVIIETPPPHTHRLQSIILISPHTWAEQGDSLSWNLAHSRGWGNQLRPDWQPPFLILFTRSLLRVFFLLLCRFAVAAPHPPPPDLVTFLPALDWQSAKIVQPMSRLTFWFPFASLSSLTGSLVNCMSEHTCTHRCINTKILKSSILVSWAHSCSFLC